MPLRDGVIVSTTWILFEFDVGSTDAILFPPPYLREDLIVDVLVLIFVVALGDATVLSSTVFVLGLNTFIHPTIFPRRGALFTCWSC